MADELSSAIAAVKANPISFCKFISSNDAGSTGAHQAGLYIPKSAISLMFDKPGQVGQNIEKFAKIRWLDGAESVCRFIYYGQGTRNEYRVTRLGKNLKEGDLIIIVRIDDANYEGFLLRTQDDITHFLGTFKMVQDDTNNLIDRESFQDLTNTVTQPIFNRISVNESNEVEVNQINFKPKAHILILLGEELIKSPVMAIYELIKNGYDADAGKIDVTFENISDPENTIITIEDTGTGLTAEVLKNVWFEPGTDFRKPIDANGVREIKRSPVHYRIPMGEKGVGRFAVHKLGNKINLISRPARVIVDSDGKFVRSELLDYEVSVNIDWRRFSQSKYLDDVSIEWYKNSDQSTFHFPDTHGTFIRLSNLKEEWTRGMARQLKRQTLSMLSPKNDPANFSINLDFRNWWLNDIPDTKVLIEKAPYKVTVLVDAQYNMIFDYEFSLANNTGLGGRKINEQTTEVLDKSKYEYNIKGFLKPFFRNYLENKEFESTVIDNVMTEFDAAELPYGNLMIELFSFDLDSTSLHDITNSPKLIRELLRDHSGIKVFKGDLRVYDYGDPGNDWLGLDLKRLQNKEWFSNNQNIGYVYLDPQNSGVLVEKTNREGFIHNAAYENFVVVLEYILTQFMVERQSDRVKWLNYNKKGIGNNTFEDQVTGFKELIESTDLDANNKVKLLNEAESIVDRYQHDKNNLLIPAGVGMTASFAMHEIEKLIPRMQETVNENPINPYKIKDQVEELRDYADGILSVLKKGGNKAISLPDAIQQAAGNYASRFRGRNIKVEINVDPLAATIMCDRRLLITILMNIIDNSVYWLDNIFREDKGLYIATYKEQRGISILIVDNGPGFKEGVEDIIRPFYSRKQNGIGIGMYLVDTVMIQYGKLNIIYDRNYLAAKGVPSTYNGAAVELIFNKLQQ